MGWMDGMVIIGRRQSKNTFGANEFYITLQTKLWNIYFKCYTASPSIMLLNYLILPFFLTQQDGTFKFFKHFFCVLFFLPSLEYVIIKGHSNSKVSDESGQDNKW